MDFRRFLVMPRGRMGSSRCVVTVIGWVAAAERRPQLSPVCRMVAVLFPAK